MAVVGTAYVHIKALANNMAKDIEDSLQPLAQNMQKAGREAGENFSNDFGKSVEGNLKGLDINPAEGLSEKVEPELEETKKKFKDAEEEIVRNNKTTLDKLADNFKNTGKKSSNSFIQNFGMGMWFNLIHRMYDMFLFLTPAIGVAGGAITQLVGGLYSMIGAMGPAVNLAGVLPGLFYAVGGSFIALNIGLKDSAKSAGLGFAAMKAMATGAEDADKQMQKYLESLEGLGPEARKFTETLVGMSGTFMDISSNIQSALLPNLTTALEKLRDNGVIDAFGRSFTDLARIAGETGLKLATLTDSPLFRGRLTTVFQSTNVVASNLGGAFVNLVEALTNVTAAAAPVTEAFSGWIEEVTGDWASSSNKNFAGLRQSFLDGADAIKLLWSVIKNLGGTLAGLGRAGSDAGRDLWESFDSVTKKWHEFVDSVEGQKSLEEFFEKSARGTKAIGNVFRELGGALTDLAGSENTIKALESLGPMIDQLGGMILRMVDEAGPALGEMTQSLLDLLDTLTEGQGVSAFANTIKIFADALNGLLSLPGGHSFLIFIATFIGIFKAASIIAQVTAFRGAVTGIIKSVSNLSKAGSIKGWVSGVTRGTDDAGRAFTHFHSGFFGGAARVRDASRIMATSVGGRFKALGTSIAGASIGMKKGFSSLATSLNPAPLFKKMKDTGKGMGTNMASGFSTVGSSMKKTASSAASGISSGFSRASTGIKNTASSAASGIAVGFSSAANKSKNAFSKAGNGIKSGFGKTMGLLGKMNPLGGLLIAVELLLPIFLMLYQSSEKFRNAVDGAFKAVSDAVQPVIPILQDLFTQITQVFSGIIETVGPPVVEAFSSIVSAIGPVLSTVGTTLGGIFSQIGPILTDVASQIGPVVTQLGPVLGSAFEQLSGAVQTLLPVLGELVGSVLATLGPMIAQLAPVIGELVGSIITLAVEAFGQLMPVIMSLVSSVLPVLMGAFQALVPLISTLVTNVLPPLVELFGAIIPMVLNNLIPIITTVIGAIVPIITSIIEVLTGVITFLTGVFTGNWSMAWDGIKGIFTGIWNLIVSVLTGVLNIIVTLVMNQFNMMKNIVATVLPAISSFFTSVWNGIASFFSGILSSIVNFAVSRWTMLRAQTTAIFNNIRASITNIINGVRNTVTGVIKSLVSQVIARWNNLRANTVNVFNAIRNAISNSVNAARNTAVSAVNRMKASIQNAWATVRSMTTSTWNSFRSTISNGVNSAMGVVRSIPGRIRSAFGNAGGMLRSVGSQIISGLVNGIRSGISRVTSAARDVANAAVRAAKRALNIKSPSRVFRDIGGFVGKGFVVGLQGTQSSVSKASAELSKKVTDAFKTRVISKKVFQNTEKIIKNGNNNMLKLAAKREQIAAKLKAAQTQLEEAVKVRNEYRDKTQESMVGILDLGDITKGMKFENVLDLFKKSTQQVKTFHADLQKLKKLGLSEDLYERIVSAGAERGSEIAKSLVQNGQAGVTQINQEFRNLVSASDKVGGEASNYLYGAGVNVAQGLIKGLQSQEKALAKQAEKMAKTIANSVKKALKIKSPSQVLRDLGTMTAQGLVKGMEEMNNEISKAANLMGKATISGAENGLAKNLAPSFDPLTGPTPQTVPAISAISATITNSKTDNSPILTPQNQALVSALSQYVGTAQTNYFSIQRDRSIQELASAISRELERTK